MRRLSSLIVVCGLFMACGAPRESGIPADADLVMQASDFDCILKWTAANNYRITNKLGYLAQTLAVANNPKGGTFPVGTVIQLIPNEAMVKRKTGWNPATRDWEFFALGVSASGTVIQASGGAEVQNHFGGGSCYGCHSAAAPQWDLICSTDHGCVPLPFGQSTIEELQNSDPRCTGG